VRILAEAIDYARQGQLEARRPVAKTSGTLRAGYHQFAPTGNVGVSPIFRSVRPPSTPRKPRPPAR
jgi:hypothetical protein